MTPARRLHGAVLLAALALALAACTGGEPPPAATPEAPPTAEAPSTPAPTAIASPEASPTPAPTAAPTPEPPPEVACASGVAVEEPEDRPGLVADCVALLASRDALRGEASLDWGADLAIERWEGVAVEGEPPRVTGLDLRDKGLTGSVPRTLGALTELTDLRLAGNRLTGAIPEWLGEMQRLSTLILVDNALTGGIPRSIGRLGLDEVRLAGNELAGCVPSAFGDARGDAAYLGLPWCLRYALDATGAVAEAGGWAILDTGGAVLATWEGLRSEAATLRVHQTDAGGTSWASEFGAVSEGDLFEWRKASDCWVRYHVAGPPVRPASGSGRWEFPVEWMTYAATGEGCKGAVASGAVLRADEDAPTVVSTAEIASPVRQGPFLIAPMGWDGEIERATPHPKPAASGPSGASASGQSRAITDYIADNIEKAREVFPYWRDPALPAAWSLTRAVQDPSGVNGPPDGYCAVYHNGEGYLGVEICAGYMKHRPHYEPVWWRDGAEVYELFTLDGAPAFVAYSPPGPAYDRLLSIRAYVFDGESGVMYSVVGYDPSLSGGDTDATIAIARSLLPSESEP